MRYVRLKYAPKIISYDESASDLEKPTALDYQTLIAKESDDVAMLCDLFYIKPKDGGSYYLHKWVDVSAPDRSDYVIYGMILHESENGAPTFTPAAKWNEGGWELL